MPCAAKPPARMSCCLNNLCPEPMNAPHKKDIPATLICGLMALALMLSLSFWARQPASKGAAGAQNLEATYHALLTIKALDENPASRHFFLPIVSLGNEGDKHIPWGATVPTARGDFIYTSFTPPGFLAPYLALRAFGASPTVRNLSYFNFGLGAVCSLIVFALLWHMLNYAGYGQRLAAGGALAGSTVGIFSREVLQSHGLVYWSHSLYQVVLAASLWLVFKYLSTDSSQPLRKNRYAHALVAAAFLGAWTEWTGYVFNLGLAVLFWFGVQGLGRARGLSVRIVAATAGAGVATLLHYALAVGFWPTLLALAGRFLARNAASGNLVQLLQGYGLSFGLFLVVLVGLLLAGIGLADSPATTSHRRKTIVAVGIAACIPLLENFLMMDHASQFSFDRLKFIFPAALLIGVTFCKGPAVLRYALVAGLALACFQGQKSYREDLLMYSKWSDIDAGNTYLAERVAHKVDTRCAVFLSNINVRGYANLLFGRGIHENHALTDSMPLLRERKACAAVFLESEWLDPDFSRVMIKAMRYPDLPSYRKAVITYPDGSTVEVDAENYFRGRFKVHPSFFISDSNWERGVALHWPGFFVPHREKLVEDYKAGNIVRLGDGQLRRIVRAVPVGEYLHVYVEGSHLQAGQVGLPSTYQTTDPTRSED